MSSPSDHLSFQFDELNRINNAISTLRRIGLGPLDPAYTALERARGVALAKLGLKIPRTSTIVKTLLGLSPGKLNLILDAERGWLVEGIERPGAAPVYRYVGEETAETLLKGELSHELEAVLFSPTADYMA